jgi:hypothetical protein
MNTPSFRGMSQSRLIPYRSAPYRPALGQAPAVSDTLSPTMEKAYRDMTAREKYLTLAGYQWLAAMTTQGLKYGSESYTPFFPVSTDSVFGFLDTAKTMLNALTSPLVALLGQFGVEMKAAPEAQRSATTTLSDLRNVRNRIIKDLVAADNVVELEYFGDLPGFPGEIVYRKVAKDKAALARPADLSALFADKDPATLLSDGLMLKEKYEEVGAEKTDIKYSMDGPALIIAGIFAVVLLVLGVLFIVRHYQFKELVFKRTMDDADKALADGKITPAQHAKIRKDAQDATDIWTQMFKGFGELPWTTIALVAGGAAAVIWGIPAIIQAFRSKPEPATT